MAGAAGPTNATNTKGTMASMEADTATMFNFKDKKTVDKVAPEKAVASGSQPMSDAKKGTLDMGMSKEKEVYTEKTYGLTSDNLKIIEGIGPKISDILNGGGIKTWNQLANASINSLKKILKKAGPKFKMHDPRNWAKQATFAAQGDWASLMQFQKDIDEGEGGSSKLEKFLIKQGKI